MTEVNRLAAALVALQKQLPHIGKAQTADLGGYTYDYADLTDITDQLMPLLSGHGLAFIAKPTLARGDDDGTVRFVLAYSLLHESGEREDGTYPLPLQGTPQAIGSAITYGRRYCLCAVTGVAPGGSDDDGAAASRQQRPEAGAEHVSPQPEPEVAARRAAWSLAVDAWKALHDGMWDPLGFGQHYEHYAAASATDATADQLTEYAEYLVAAKATELDKEAKPDGK